MKKLIIALSLGLTIAAFNINTANAQHVSVNINLDFQPAWGPSGYHYAAFYYFPDLNIYYDVNNGLFVYLNKRRWVSSIYLPQKYRKYDLYLMYKVVLNDIYTPWMYNKNHKRSYARFCNNRSQIAIYYMNDRHYHSAKRNYWAWVEPRYMPKQKHQNHRHLAHQHNQIHVNKNANRSSASNAKSHSPRNNNQMASNNRSTKRHEQPKTHTNRVESRSTNARSSENRSAASNRNNEVRKNESKQAQKADQQRARKNEQTVNKSRQRSEIKSDTRSNKERQSVEKRNGQKERDDKRSQGRSENRSRNGSRSKSR